MLPTNAAPRYDRRLVGWLSLAQMISWGTLFYGFSLLMQPLEEELDMGRVRSSLGFSLALLVEGALGYAVGRLIDRGHGRAVMCAGSALAALAWGAHALVHSQTSFFAVWLLLGVAMAGTLYSPAFAIVTRRYPADFRRAIITLTFLGGLASTVFIPLIAWLIAHLGWRQCVGVLATLHLLVCLPVHWLCLKDEPARPVMLELGQAGAVAQSAQRLWTSPAFLFIGVFVVLMMGVTSALPAHMVSLLREQGFSERWVVGVPALIGLLQVFGRVLMFLFEHRFDVHKSNRWIPALIPLGLALLLLAGWLAGSSGALAMALLFAAFYGMGNGMMTIVKGTAIALYVNREQVATLNGLLAAPTAIARALAPLALGAMWTAKSGYRDGLLLLLVASGIAILALVGAQKASLTTGR